MKAAHIMIGQQRLSAQKKGMYATKGVRDEALSRCELLAISIQILGWLVMTTVPVFSG